MNSNCGTKIETLSKPEVSGKLSDDQLLKKFNIKKCSVKLHRLKSSEYDAAVIKSSSCKITGSDRLSDLNRECQGSHFFGMQNEHEVRINPSYNTKTLPCYGISPDIIDRKIPLLTMNCESEEVSKEGSLMGKSDPLEHLTRDHLLAPSQTKTSPLHLNNRNGSNAKVLKRKTCGMLEKQGKRCKRNEQIPAVKGDANYIPRKKYELKNCFSVSRFPPEILELPQLQSFQVHYSRQFLEETAQIACPPAGNSVVNLDRLHKDAGLSQFSSLSREHFDQEIIEFIQSMPEDDKKGHKITVVRNGEAVKVQATKRKMWYNNNDFVIVDNTYVIRQQVRKILKNIKYPLVQVERNQEAALLVQKLTEQNKIEFVHMSKSPLQMDEKPQPQLFQVHYGEQIWKETAQRANLSAVNGIIELDLLYKEARLSQFSNKQKFDYEIKKFVNCMHGLNKVSGQMLKFSIQTGEKPQPPSFHVHYGEHYLKKIAERACLKSENNIDLDSLYIDANLSKFSILSREKFYLVITKLIDSIHSLNLTEKNKTQQPEIIDSPLNINDFDLITSEIFYDSQICNEFKESIPDNQWADYLLNILEVAIEYDDVKCSPPAVAEINCAQIQQITNNDKNTDTTDPLKEFNRILLLVIKSHEECNNTTNAMKKVTYGETLDCYAPFLVTESPPSMEHFDDANENESSNKEEEDEAESEKKSCFSYPEECYGADQQL